MPVTLRKRNPPLITINRKMSSKVDMANVAAKLAAIINKLDAELMCGICNHTMVDCRRVTCGHWFCMLCMEDVFKNRPAGQRTAVCPDCGHGINRRSLKEDDVMQVIIERVAEAKQIVDDNGLAKAGQSADRNSSSSDGSSFSSAATSSLSEDTPPEKAKQKAPAKEPAAARSDEAKRESEEADEAAAAASRSGSMREEDLPATPDVSFETLVELSRPSHVLKSTPVTATPVSSHLSTGRRSDRIADLSKSGISNASINASKKKLFDGEDCLSESSSESEHEQDAAHDDEVAACFRSGSTTPARKGLDMDGDTSVDYSKQSSHTSQFFANWPYVSPVLETGSGQKSGGKEEKNKNVVIETGRADGSPDAGPNGELQKLSPAPSFMATSPWSQATASNAKPVMDMTFSVGTQTSTLRSEISDRISGSFNTQLELESFIHNVIKPALRETLSDVSSLNL